jgi:hypothetical protein
MSFRIKLPVRVVALVVLGLTLAILVRGQTPSGPQSRSTRPDPVQRELQRQAEMQIIEKALIKQRPQRVQRYTPLVLEQIKSDFLGIQIIDRRLAQATSAPGILDLRLVVTSVAEIRKLSKRLKRNLDLPAPAAFGRPGIAVEAEIESLRFSLPVLSKLIDELVTNPMFEQSRLVDSQLSANALRDIEAIIKLSGEIKRSSEKLQATAKVP